MAKRAEGAIGMRGRMRRQGPLDRFDESVGEDESLLDRIAKIVDMPREAIAAAIRGEDERGLAGFTGDVAGDPLSYADDRGRITAGSFNMDPGMRAPDEFTDVASAGYREQAKRVAERGGDKQYATSVEEEEADAEADERRKQLMFVLAALIGGGAGGMGASRMMGPGARPGLGVGARNPSQAEWNAMKTGGHLNRRGRIMDRIEGVLDGGRGARAVDAGALGGMVSPIAYDMIQRRRRRGG